MADSDSEETPAEHALGLLFLMIYVGDQKLLGGPLAGWAPTLLGAVRLALALGMVQVAARTIEPTEERTLGTGQWRFWLAAAPAVLLGEALHDLSLAGAVGPYPGSLLVPPLLALAVGAALRSEFFVGAAAWFLAFEVGEVMAAWSGSFGGYATSALFAHLAASLGMVGVGLIAHRVAPRILAGGLVGGAGASVATVALLLADRAPALLGLPDSAWLAWPFLALHWLTLAGLYVVGRRLDLGLPQGAAMVGLAFWGCGALMQLGLTDELAFGVAALVIFGLRAASGAPDPEAPRAFSDAERLGWPAARRHDAGVACGLVALAFAFVVGLGAFNRWGSARASLAVSSPVEALPRRILLALDRPAMRHDPRPGEPLTAWLTRPRLDPEAGRLALGVVVTAEGAPPPADLEPAEALPVPATVYQARNEDGGVVRYLAVHVRRQLPRPDGWRRRQSPGRPLTLELGALGFPYLRARPGAGAGGGRSWLGVDAELGGP